MSVNSCSRQLATHRLFETPSEKAAVLLSVPLGVSLNFTSSLVERQPALPMNCLFCYRPHFLNAFLCRIQLLHFPQRLRSHSKAFRYHTMSRWKGHDCAVSKIPGLRWSRLSFLVPAGGSEANWYLCPLLVAFTSSLLLLPTPFSFHLFSASFQPVRWSWYWLLTFGVRHSRGDDTAVFK